MKRGRSRSRSVSRGRRKYRKGSPINSRGTAFRALPITPSTGRRASTGGYFGAGVHAVRALSAASRAYSARRAAFSNSDPVIKNGENAAVSKSYCKVSYAKKKGGIPKFHKVHKGMPCLYMQNDSGDITSTNGNQQWTFFDNVWGGWTANSGVFQNEMNTCAGMLAQTISGSASSAPGFNPNGKIFVKYITIELTIVNCGMTPTEIVLCDYKYRKNAVNGAGTYLTPNANPGTEWDNWGQVAMTNAETVTYEAAGYELTDSSQFTKNVKIIQRKSFWLKPGDVHVHKSFLWYNKIYDNSLVLANPTQAYWAGWSFGTALRQKGIVATGATSGSDIAKTCIRWYNTYRSHTSPVSLFNRYHMQIVNNPNTNTPIVGNLKIYNEALGEAIEEGGSALTTLFST